jgi:head-tail adaptor
MRRRGRYRHLITLQKTVTSGTDAFGAPIKAWQTVNPVWADISPASMTSARGAELRVLDAAVYGLDPVIVTFQPYPGVKIDWRFLYYNDFSDFIETYEIKAVRETNADDEMSFIAARVLTGTT